MIRVRFFSRGETGYEQSLVNIRIESFEGNEILNRLLQELWSNTLFDDERK